LGLELLSLLVGKQLGDFYCLLERIPLNERTVKCIDYVVSLEKHLMEGNYNQLLKMRQKSPSSLYKSLLNNLEATIQDEVASCIEQSYPSISVVCPQNKDHSYPFLNHGYSFRNQLLSL